jgi:LysR family transcriptional regulator (chromosome initiation inhibitor)
MSLDYNLLAALAAVVREGSFERAARALHVTPSAVSQRVKLLEARMGSVLVARGTPCSATDIGAALCRHVERVAVLEQELRERLPVLGAVGSEQATIRIAVGADSVATWCVRALARVAARRPELLFDVVIEDQEHTATLLRSGSVHGAVTTVAEPVAGCHSTPLGKLRYLATCAPRFHQRYFGNGVTRAALEEAPSLLFNGKDTLQHEFARRITRARLELPVHRIPSSHAFVEACVQELGWAMNAEPLVTAQVASGALVELVPGQALDVALYWQTWRLDSEWLDELTRTLVTEARRSLRNRGKGARGKQ